MIVSGLELRFSGAEVKSFTDLRLGYYPGLWAWSLCSEGLSETGRSRIMDTVGGLQTTWQSQATLRGPDVSGFHRGGKAPLFRARKDCKVLGSNVKSEGSVKCKKRLSPVPASVAFVPMSVDGSWETSLPNHPPRGIGLGRQTKY